MNIYECAVLWLNSFLSAVKNKLIIFQKIVQSVQHASESKHHNIHLRKRALIILSQQIATSMDGWMDGWIRNCSNAEHTQKERETVTNSRSAQIV